MIIRDLAQFHYNKSDVQLVSFSFFLAELLDWAMRVKSEIKFI